PRPGDLRAPGHARRARQGPAGVGGIAQRMLRPPTSVHFSGRAAMIKRFLHFFRRSAKPSQSLSEPQLALTRTRVGDTSLVRLNVDDWEPDTQQALHALAAKHAHLTFHDGKVQHGYALSHVATQTQCPRCHADTQQHYTNVIYATQTAPRVLFA